MKRPTKARGDQPLSKKLVLDVASPSAVSDGQVDAVFNQLKQRILDEFAHHEKWSVGITRKSSRGKSNMTAESATEILEKFLDSSRSEIAELLNAVGDKNEGADPTVESNSVLCSTSIDALQSKLSSKLRSHLSNLSSKKSSKPKNTEGNNIAKTSASTNNDLSSLVQDFITSAKQKLSASLSNSESASQKASTSLSVTRSGNNSRVSAVGDGDERGSSSCQHEADVDDPSTGEDTDSDDEVVLLEGKPRVIEEITIDEDDDDESEKSSGNSSIEELLYNCPKCSKQFRVESFLKFHVRMHDSAISDSV